MDTLTRRHVLKQVPLGAAAGAATASAADTPRHRRKAARRTMYFNDARHYYLYAFEPPLKMADAWRPIDELAGTSVNTFIYGIETEGLFTDTKVARRAPSDTRPFTSALAWRAWYNLQSLIDRGLNPLQVLIDRAHERGLDFIVSMRMGGGPSDPRYFIGGPGRAARFHDYAHAPVRDVRFRWLEELAAYPVDGVELDFAYTPFYFKPEAARANASLMTDYVRKVSTMIRPKGRDRIVGARVFPTVAMNLALGLDVEAWLSQKLVDYVAPLYYGYFRLDPNLPFDSLVKAAHAAKAAVYPVLQPYYVTDGEHATTPMLRAAAANFWARGADGLIVAPWFRWPFRDQERSFLTDIGDPATVAERDKHYFVGHRLDDAAELGYRHPLPAEVPSADPGRTQEIPFYIADDCASPRVARVRVLVRISNLLTADRIRISLNGVTLDRQPLRKTTHRYEFLWLEYLLETVRPKKGENVLGVALEARPEGMGGGVIVDRVETIIEYSLPHSFYERPGTL
ncbi:MAG: hypothetical protein ACKV22_00850 [Bryobacteraceae bacterium]